MPARSARSSTAKSHTLAASPDCMKPSVKAELTVRREVLVDEARCVGFMGKEGMVYATRRMVSDVEYTCRDFLLEHLEAGEDSVGARVSIDHLAATPLGLKAVIEAK